MALGRAGERVRSAERDPGGGLLIQSGIHPSPLLIPVSLSLLGAHWGPSPTPDASRLGLGPNERERAWYLGDKVVALYAGPRDDDGPSALLVKADALNAALSRAGLTVACQWPRRSPHWWPRKVPTPDATSAERQATSPAGQRLAHPEALAVGHDDRGVMEQPVEERHRGRVLGDEPAPLLERPVAGDPERPALVRRGDEAEQELGADGVEGRKPQLVDDEKVGSQEPIDDLADRVVGETAIERRRGRRP